LGRNLGENENKCGKDRNANEPRRLGALTGKDTSLSTEFVFVNAVVTGCVASQALRQNEHLPKAASAGFASSLLKVSPSAITHFCPCPFSSLASCMMKIKNFEFQLHSNLQLVSHPCGKFRPSTQEDTGIFTLANQH